MQLLFSVLFAPASPLLVDSALCFMRIGIGLLTVIHGIPKIKGGVDTWKSLGSAVNPLGIYFLPIIWGFLAACAEFFGGIALILGLGTRLASLALAIMMFVAAVWHIERGDKFTVYSFALSLMVVFLTWVIIGGGPFSLDRYLF